MEEQVQRSLHEMLTQLDNLPDKNNVDLYWPIQLCVGNVINETLFGFHYNYDNYEEFKTFVSIIDRHLKIAQNRLALLISAFPWMKNVPVLGEMGYHSVKRNIKSVSKRT